jgi:hypothetical protein
MNAPVRLKHLRSLLVLLCTGFLFSCTVPAKMPFAEDDDTIKETDGALMIMTATVKNQFRPAHQTHYMTMHIERSGSGEKEIVFDIPREEKARENSKEQGAKFLVRFQLAPGNYRLVGFRGMTQDGGWPTLGNFYMPLHIDFEIPASGVYYLGDVNGVNRERKDGEFRSAPAVPGPNDAQNAGFYEGTFELSVDDILDEDVALFRQRFSYLRGKTIERQILSQPNPQRALKHQKEAGVTEGTPEAGLCLLRRKGSTRQPTMCRLLPGLRY